MQPSDDAPSPRHAALVELASRGRLVARRQHLDTAAVEVIAALGAVGVDVLVLKGPALARKLYHQGEERGYFDIDLLVAPDQLAGASEILSRLGYSEVSAQRGIDDVAGLMHAQVWSRLQPGYGNLTIDLHWRLDGCNADAGTVWSALWAGRSEIELEDTLVQTLGLDGLALSLALHATQHGPVDAKAMGDLRRGLERWPRETWDAAAELAEHVQAVEALAGGLRLMSLGARMAEDLALPAADGLLWDITHRESRPRGVFHLQALSEARTVRRRARIVRLAVFPSRAWIRWELPWARKSRAHLAAAYVRHVARTPVWTVRALAHRRWTQPHRD